MALKIMTDSFALYYCPSKKSNWKHTLAFKYLKIKSRDMTANNYIGMQLKFTTLGSMLHQYPGTDQ